MAKIGPERVRTKCERRAAWLECSRGREWVESLEEKPRAIINSFMMLGVPFQKTFITTSTCMCQAYLYSNYHLFLLSIDFQQIISKCSGLKMMIYYFSYLFGFEIWGRVQIWQQGCSAACAIGWCLSLSYLFSYLGRD